MARSVAVDRIFHNYVAYEPYWRDDKEASIR